MKPNPRSSRKDTSLPDDLVADCWSLFVGGSDPEIDLRVHGASSLELLRFELELRRRSGRAVSLESIEGPVNLAAVREAVEAGPEIEAEPDHATPATQGSPATAAQASQWLAERMRPTHRGYLVPILVELPDRTPWSRLSRAIERVVRIHPALRTKIESCTDEPTELRQVVEPSPRLVVVEPRSVPDLDDESIAMVMDGMGNYFPSVSSGRPWRAIGLQVDGRLRALLLLVHHVAVDEPSIRIIVRDLHEGLVADGEIQDQVDGEGGRDLLEIGRIEAREPPSDQDLEWWRDRLADVPDRLPIVSDSRVSSRTRRRTILLDPSLVEKLDAKLIDGGVVRSAVILRAVRRALHRLGIEDDGDLPIGVPVSLRDHPAVEETVGMLLNTLPVPIGRHDGLEEITSRVRECRRRRRVPYERIARDLPSEEILQPGRSRWLDLVVGTLEADRAPSLPMDCRVTPPGDSPFPLLVIARFERTGCRIECDADPACFPDADVEAFLTAVEDEIHSVIHGASSTNSDSIAVGDDPSHERIALHDLVTRSRDRTPEAIAIEDGSLRLTYAQFQSRIDGMAGRILSVITDSSRPVARPIGIMGRPESKFFTAVVAAMKVGGAAMPIPMATPAARIASIVERARPAVMIVMEEGERRVVEEAIAIAGVDVPVIVAGSEVECEAMVAFEVDPDLACYLLFTSGSSGEPKAVRMHHAGIAGLIDHECRRIHSAGGARTAQFAPLGFDVSFQEMFTTWAAGGTLVTIPTGVREDPHAMARFLQRERIERLHMPPLMLRALAISCPGGFPGALREIVCAGEALRIDDEIRRAASGSSVRLLNQYGPTETHVVTQHDLGSDPGTWSDLPPIGLPIDGVEIRIESPGGDVVGVGEVGELVVRGDAVALGYLDGDEGGFFREADDSRCYRTGDRARIGMNGMVEYLGRFDEQVKISGYRVDPGEIEVSLLELESVSEAAVITVPRDDLRDGHELVAFVVGPSEERELEACLDELRTRLPAWLVPARIRSIPAIPRSANGKVDRAGLRDEVSRRPFVGHRFGSGWTAGDVLRKLEEAPGDREPKDPLGALGIDSLGAIRLQEGLSLHHGLELPIVEILESSLADLRDRVRSGGGGKPIEGGFREQLRMPRWGSNGRSPSDGKDTTEWRPLDPLVRDVLAEDALAPEGAFHLAWTIEFPEDLDPEEIARRLAAVGRRHQTLRTCRRPELGERVLDIDEALPIDLEVFPQDPSEEERRRILRHPLRLADGMPWRAATWMDCQGRRVLLLVIHHAAVDGRTARLILDELVTEAGDNDFVVGKPMNVGSNEIDEEWWIDRVRSAMGGESLPMVGFEDAERRSVAFDGHGGDVFRLAGEEAARHGLPPITPALLAWALVLGRGSGRSRVVIGVPFATELDEAGLGASILPVVVRVSDAILVTDALADVAGTVAGGLDHRGATLGRIVRRIAGDTPFTRPPLDGVITRDDVERRHEGAVVRWTSTGAGVFQAGFVVPSTDEGLSTAIDVEAGVLDGEDPRDLLERLMITIGEITEHLRDGGSATAMLGDLDCLTSRQRRLIDAFGIGDSRDAQATEEGSISISSRFDSIVADHADRIAVIDRDETLTFAELSKWSASIAAGIVEGCGDIRGRSVAIAGSRSAGTIASMLGVVRAGGWFVPIDQDIPEERRARQLESCRPVAMLSPRGQAVTHDGMMDLDPHALRGGPGLEPSDHDPTGEAPLYAMFTSGTTGEPRGAVIPHRAVHRLIDDAWFLPAGPGFRMLHAAPLAFDASTLEIWWPLLNGGTICCWEGSAADLPALHARMIRDQVRGCWLTAALFHAGVDGLPELFADLDVVLTGGDVVSPDHVQRLHARHPELAIVDGYGPTENTVFTACESIVPGGLARGSVPIGRPVRGTSLRIVDSNGHDVPPGRFGELVASGSGVGLGYLGNDGQPEDRDGFQRDAPGDSPVYRTGDRVRWRSDGRLEFGGRYDSQVKIAGHRIELGGVESVLRGIDGVMDACVVVDSENRRSIGALVVLEESVTDVPGRIDRIRRTASGRLATWEVPALMESVDSIPTTRNGKPDRREVDRILRSSRREETVAPVEPRQDELLAIVCDSIASISGVSVVEPQRSIRDLGIDSLDLLRLAI